MAIVKPLRVPSVRELFRLAPVRTLFAAIAFINGFVFVAVWETIGGTALGTAPSKHGFVVVSHGVETAVSERLWLASLGYTLATMMLTPAAFLLLATVPLRWVKTWHRYFILCVVLIFATLMYYTTLRDASHSIRDYVRMNASVSTACSPWLIVIPFDYLAANETRRCPHTRFDCDTSD